MIADSQAREQALNPVQSFIVQAPAGSGKTGLLVYRYLTLLALVERPEQVLAITFTRKATNEMQERVIELLHAALAQSVNSEEVIETDPFVVQGIELAKKVLQQDAKHDWQLLKLPQQLQIQTIDSLCARLTGYMPWLSRLGESPRTTEQPQAHYQAVVEQLFAELLNPESRLAPALKTVLLALDYDYRKARQMFVVMLSKRDQWLRHLLAHDLSALRSNMQLAWQNVIEQHLHALRDAFPRTQRQAVLEILKQCGELFSLSKPEKANPFISCLTPEHFPEAAAEQLPVWQAIRFLLASQKGYRASLSVNQGFPAGKEHQAHKQAMKDVLAEVADNDDLLELLLALDTLPNSQFADADWQQLLALEQVLKTLAALLQLRFRNAGECDFSEVTQRANLALQELDNPTDLALRMDYRLQHILVDEFQDTSHAQIELLKKLTAGWGLDGSLCDQVAEQQQTLFLVGDPMQSIYRFREADVGLFLQVAQDGQQVFSNIKINSLQLTENFRSGQGLVEWFNHTFYRSFPKKNNLAQGAISYVHATSSKKLKTQVSCIPVCTKQQQAEQIVSQITQAQTRLEADAKIAVLVRSRTQLNNILPVLKAANIAYTGIEIQRLDETPAVLDLVALCKALNRIDDRVAWLALLRGPWCGLTLRELNQLVTQLDTPVWLQIQKKAGQAGVLSDESQCRLERFCQLMGKALEQRQQVSLGDLVFWTWQQLGGEHTVFDASMDDMQVVFDLIYRLEQYADLSTLEQAIEGLYAQPEQSDIPDGADHREFKPNPVIVSTMHKAKGLEYDTVILPDLGNQGRSDDKQIMLWSEQVNAQGQDDLLLAPIDAQNQANTHYNYLRQLESQRARNELMRLMYVACTRARRQLILLGVIKHDKNGEPSAPHSNSLLRTVWPALAGEFDIAQDQSQEQGKEQTLSQKLTRVPSDFIAHCQPSIQWQSQHQLASQQEQTLDGMMYEWATSVAKAVGIILHEWLQYNQTNLFQLTVSQQLRSNWRAQLKALQVPNNRLDAAMARLVKAVRTMQADPQAQFIFKDYPEQHNEYAVASFEQGRVHSYRIDRTFVDEHNVRWIVDYKSTFTHNDDVAEFVEQQVAERHKDQLHKYAQLMSQMEHRPIKLGVYYPLLGQFYSWDYE